MLLVALTDTLRAEGVRVPKRFSAVVRPIPWMYMRAITTRFCGGMSTPAILAI